jgi:hypothetical protein
VSNQVLDEPLYFDRVDDEVPDGFDGWWTTEAPAVDVVDNEESQRHPDADEVGHRAYDADVRAEFDRAADELAAATVSWGSLRAATREPAYGEILALGQRAIPLLLERVDDPVQGPLWMRLLGSLIVFPPMLRMDSVADAAEAWQIWGRSLGHIAK